MPPHSGGLVLAHFVEPVIISLKRLAAFVSNDNMDPAKTSSRPRYSAGNRLFYRLLRVSRDDNFLYGHYQTLQPSEPPFHYLSSAPMLGIVRYS